MKPLFKIALYTLTAILFCCVSACMQDATFSEDELRFAEPFTKADTAIYQSEKGLVDTIIFHEAINDTLKVRNIEQGFYNNRRLTVSYELTKNSYHKFAVKSVNDEPENFIHFAKAKGSHQSKEISFLGMVFSEEYLKKINVSNKNEITFSVDNATYNEVNINEGIKSFVFDFDKGITSFVDRNNIKWEKVSVSNIAQGDSLYKIGDFLFKASKSMRFEFVKRGNQPAIKTKGDTIYADNNLVLLGDFSQMKGEGVYKKFKFKSNFSDYKVDDTFKGTLAKPNFSSDQKAKAFRTNIEKSCESSGVNYAGHYTIIEWGCGAACQLMAIVDRINGNIIFSKIPFDTLDGHCGLDYKIDSRMLVVNTEAISDYEGYKLDYWRKPAVYKIEDNIFKKVE